MSKESKHLAEIAAGVNALGASGALARNSGHESAHGEKLPLMGRLILALGSSDKRTSGWVSIARTFPIVALVGPNGGGKSLAMILMTLPTRRGIRWECDNPAHLHTARGETSGWRRILSTVAILDGKGQPHPLWDPFTDFQQFVDAEHCDVLMDEVMGVASSRESQRMDARVANKLTQMRRCDVVLRVTAPNWARMDKVIREVCQAVIECRGFFPGRPKLGTQGSAGIWAPKRVFRFRIFDSLEFDEWTASKREKLDAVRGVWFKGIGSDAFAAYDTLDAVSVVAGMTPEDTCTVCEGRIVRPICKGHRAPSRGDAVDIELAALTRGAE